MAAMRHGNGGKELDISNADVPLSTASVDDLPHCPKCGDGLLRPGVVWFGEMLPRDTLRKIDHFINQCEKIDLIMVIGTSAKVHPAIGYVEIARQKGAKVAVVNMDVDSLQGTGLQEGDWFFHGDAAVIVPEILASVTGKI
jgi:NAD-dependent deacetylase sirtuin 5